MKTFERRKTILKTKIKNNCFGVAREERKRRVRDENL